MTLLTFETKVYELNRVPAKDGSTGHLGKVLRTGKIVLKAEFPKDD